MVLADRVAQDLADRFCSDVKLGTEVDRHRELIPPVIDEAVNELHHEERGHRQDRLRDVLGCGGVDQPSEDVWRQESHPFDEDEEQ